MKCIHTVSGKFQAGRFSFFEFDFLDRYVGNSAQLESVHKKSPEGMFSRLRSTLNRWYTNE